VVVNDIQRSGKSSGFVPVAALIYALPNERDLEEAYKTIGGQSLAGIASTALGSMDQFQDAMSAAARPEGDANLSTGFAMTEVNSQAPSSVMPAQNGEFPHTLPQLLATWHDWRAWGSVLYQVSARDGSPTNGIAAVSSHLSGLALGMDWQVSEHTVLGFAIAEMPSTFKVPELNTTGNVHALSEGIYGLTYFDDADYMKFNAAFADDTLSVQRNIDLGTTEETESASFGGHTYGGRLEFGHDIAWQDLGFVPNGWSGLMTPFVALNAQDYLQAPFREASITAAGAPGMFGLAIKASDNGLFESSVGTQLASHFAIDGSQIAPYVRAAYLHEFVRIPTVGAAFEGAPDYPFMSSGAGLDSDMVRFDAGATISLRPDFGLYARATETIGATAHSTSGTIGAVIRW